METGNSQSGVAKERFLTVGNALLLVVGVVGVVCLIVFIVRAKNYCRRTKEVAQTAEAKPIETKPPAPPAPDPEKRKDKVEAPLLPRKEEKVSATVPTADKMVSKDLDEAKADDPLVTESHLVSTCEKYYGKTKRFVCDKIRTVKNFIVKCQNESPPIRTPGMRGRKQNDVRAFQFERAILYQMGHGRCSRRNACDKSFIALKNGYSSSRSTYDYWGDHKVEAEVAIKSLAVRAAEAGLTVTKYYDAHYLEHKSILRELNT